MSKFATIVVCSWLLFIILVILSLFREVPGSEWKEFQTPNDARKFARECREKGGSTVTIVGAPNHSIRIKCNET